ncbi:MAG: hypothetical protein AB7V26_14440 [Lysobacterales bacterium]
MNEFRDEQFWREFLNSSEAVRKHIMTDRMREAFEIVEMLLQRSGFNFAFELTKDEHSAILVLTPEGDALQARRIDDLLAIQPEIPGWSFFGRRQRKSLEDALTFVRKIYGLDVSDARFQLVSTDFGNEVIVVSNAMLGLSIDESYGLAVTLLDHALGEDHVMSKVYGVRGAISSDIGSEQLLTLSQLAIRLGCS